MDVSDPDPEPRPTPGSDAHWTFLTNHAHVLVTIARDPQCRMREVASRVGITERGAQKIVADLVAGGYITRTRIGRRNSYQIATGRPFRHPVTDGHELDELLAVLVPIPPRHWKHELEFANLGSVLIVPPHSSSSSESQS